MRALMKYRIVRAKTDDNESKFQLRLDAGEVRDGKKTIDP